MLQIPKGYLRFSGFALLIGGLMGFTGQLVHLEDVPATVADIPRFVGAAMNSHVYLAWASIFILMGLPAIYLAQSAKLKWWGWLSFPLLFTGLMLEIFHGPVQILAYPVIFSNVETADQLLRVATQINNMAVETYPQQLLVLLPLMPGLFGGVILLGASALKANVFPKAAGILAFVVIAIAVAYFTLPVKLKFLEVSFAYFHLIFATFGALLAFNKRIGGQASTQQTAA